MRARPGNGSDSPSTSNLFASRLSSHGTSLGRAPTPVVATPSNDWGNRFLQAARALGNQGIEYDEDWRPPGESQAWTMDCSNTARYLYKVTTGIQLAPHRLRPILLSPSAGQGVGRAARLPTVGRYRVPARNLKPGDLLFWENTYRPERQPPITHVMVFLGTNDKGQWIMAGSQSSHGGEHNRRNGGPDIYVFRPPNRAAVTRRGWAGPSPGPFLRLRPPARGRSVQARRRRERLGPRVGRAVRCRPSI